MAEKTEYREPKTAWMDITVFDVPLKKWALYVGIVITLKMALIYFGVQASNPLINYVQILP